MAEKSTRKTYRLRQALVRHTDCAAIEARLSRFSELQLDYFFRSAAVQLTTTVMGLVGASPVWELIKKRRPSRLGT